jgi:probable HAF family extracellular repeat protein
MCMKFAKQKRIVAMAFTIVLAIPAGLRAQQQEPKQQRYEFFDVGTFGGPTSTVSESQLVLSNDGTLVGGADTSEVDPYKPDCFDSACYVQHAYKWRKGHRLQDLGPLLGGKSGLAYWINSSGAAAGWSENGEIDSQSGWPVWHATLWNPSKKPFDLGTLGGVYSQAVAMNSSGQVTGPAQNTTPTSCVLPFNFPNTETEIRAVLWEPGKKSRDIGTLGGTSAFAQYMNDAGQIAGLSFIKSTSSRPGCPPVDPFFWEKGQGMKDLGSLGGTFGQLFWLNNHGQVVGESNLAGDGNHHAFYWKNPLRKMMNLGTLGGHNSGAAWINEAGEIVGYANLPGDSTTHPVVWKTPMSKIHDLGTLPGKNCGFAEAVNLTGQIVGMSESHTEDCQWPGPGMNATLWQNGQVIDLNQRIPPNSSLHLAIAVQINDSGAIAGIGVPSGCATEDMDLCGHAFVLIPIADSDVGADDQNGESTDVVPAAIPASSYASSYSQLPSRKRQGYRYSGPVRATNPTN